MKFNLAAMKKILYLGIPLASLFLACSSNQLQVDNLDTIQMAVEKHCGCDQVELVIPDNSTQDAFVVRVKNPTSEPSEGLAEKMLNTVEEQLGTDVGLNELIVRFESNGQTTDFTFDLGQFETISTAQAPDVLSLSQLSHE